MTYTVGKKIDTFSFKDTFHIQSYCDGKLYK